MEKHNIIIRENGQPDTAIETYSETEGNDAIMDLDKNTLTLYSSMLAGMHRELRDRRVRQMFSNMASGEVQALKLLSVKLLKDKMTLQFKSLTWQKEDPLLENMTTRAGNIIIAHFMGYTVERPDDGFTYLYKDGMPVGSLLELGNYSRDWNHLMKAVVKVNSYLKDPSMAKELQNVNDTLTTTLDIRQVWVEVIKFIQVLNKNRNVSEKRLI